jgi:hypothetical protein
MSYEVSLDGYPPEPYDDRQLIRYAGAWAFKKFYDIEYEGIPKSSIIVGDHVLDIQTVTEEQTNLLCTVDQPYGEIIVLAALDIQEKRIRFLGWQYFEEVQKQIYPPKLFANRLCWYIHTTRLKHMSLLDALLEIEPNHEKY